MRTKRFFSRLILCLICCFIAGRSASAVVSGEPAQNTVTTVSAANFAAPIGAESIAAAFGQNLATRTEAAAGLPLPTELAGTTVSVRDQAAMERTAQIFFVSAGQVNYVIPAGTAAGTATVTIRSGNGAVSTGTVEIRAGAPGLFSARSNGSGVAAAQVLRVKTDGAQVSEEVSQFNGQEVIAKTVCLGPSGERLFLILFLTGMRSYPNGAAVRVVINNEMLVPAFVGPHPVFVGLDQINVELPASLLRPGLLSLTVTAPDLAPSNTVEIDLGGSCTGSQLNITGFASPSGLAGTALLINGSGFSTDPKENTVRFPRSEGGLATAEVVQATSDQLLVLVPFGAETGVVTVATPQDVKSSPTALRIRTSVSGFIHRVERINDVLFERKGIKGMTVRALAAQGTVTTTTNDDGAFVLPDLAPTSALVLEIDGTTVPQVSYPRVTRKMPVGADRDNQYPEYVEMKAITGAGATIAPEGAQTVVALHADAESPDQTVGGVTLLVPTGAVVTFPDGTTGGQLRLDVLDANRAPARLPPQHFSSVIAQITPFGARISPGAKLTFPNPDGYAAGSQVRLFKYDQDRQSPNLAEFVDIGAATVSADGQRIETGANAVTEATYYFVSQVRPTIAVIGRTVEDDLARTPVRRAVIGSRGRDIFTDGNGGYVLRNVPIRPGNAQFAGRTFAVSNGVVQVGDERIAVEANFMRPTQIVSRAQRADVASNAGGTTMAGDLVVPTPPVNRPPVISAPPAFTIAAGQTRDINFLVTDEDAGQTLQVTVSGASFASVTGGSNGIYVLRLTPPAGAAGTYTLIITAIDNLGGVGTHRLVLTVN